MHKENGEGRVPTEIRKSMHRSPIALGLCAHFAFENEGEKKPIDSSAKSTFSAMEHLATQSPFRRIASYENAEKLIVVDCLAA
jgi:hypothetical protein